MSGHARTTKLRPIDDEAAIRALARLTGADEDKQLIARTVGLLVGRVEALCEALAGDAE